MLIFPRPCVGYSPSLFLLFLRRKKCVTACEIATSPLEVPRDGRKKREGAKGREEEEEEGPQGENKQKKGLAHILTFYAEVEREETKGMLITWLAGEDIEATKGKRNLRSYTFDKNKQSCFMIKISLHAFLPQVDKIVWQKNVFVFTPVRASLQ